MRQGRLPDVIATVINPLTHEAEFTVDELGNRDVTYGVYCGPQSYTLRHAPTQAELNRIAYLLDHGANIKAARKGTQED